MDYEYKCVGGPERGKKAKSAKTRSDRVAVAMEEIIADEATDGWEYLRTDLVPVEEKTSFFSRTQEVHRAVMIFRRAIGPAPRRLFAAPQGADRAPMADPAPAYEPRPRQPAPDPAYDPHLRGPAAEPAYDRQPEPEEEFRLAAERLRPEPAPEPAPASTRADRPQPPRRPQRAPSGLS